jgi:hypothetical protein
MSDRAERCKRKENTDENFLFYVTHALWHVRRMTGRWRDQGTKWINSLVRRKPRTAKNKTDRNLHMSSDVLYMRTGEMKGMYAERQPPMADEPLTPNSADIEAQGRRAPFPHERYEYRHIRERVRKIIGGEKSPKEAKKPEIGHTSKDKRIYRARRALYKGPGSNAFHINSTERKRKPGNVAIRDTGRMVSDRKEIGSHCHRDRQDTDESNSEPCSTAWCKISSHHLTKRKPPQAKEMMSPAYNIILTHVDRAMEGGKNGRIGDLLKQMEKDERTNSAYVKNIGKLPPPTIRAELLGELLDTIVDQKMAHGREILRDIEEHLSKPTPENPTYSSANEYGTSRKTGEKVNRRSFQTHSAKVGHDLCYDCFP